MTRIKAPTYLTGDEAERRATVPATHVWRIEADVPNERHVLTDGEICRDEYHILCSTYRAVSKLPGQEWSRIAKMMSAASYGLHRHLLRGDPTAA